MPLPAAGCPDASGIEGLGERIEGEATIGDYTYLVYGIHR